MKVAVLIQNQNFFESKHLPRIFLDRIVPQNSMAVVPKRNNLPLEMPDRGWAAGAACDVTGAMRSPPGSDFVMVIIVFVTLRNDDDLKIR